MIEVHKNLFVGNAADFESSVADPEGEHGIKEGWAAVHACKEPYHRKLLGYTGRGAPKDHPEYQIAVRGNRMYLNIVDTPDPRFFSAHMIHKAALFIKKHLGHEGRNVLVHCNEGCSRGPSIALYYLRKFSAVFDCDFKEGEEKFKLVYPPYKPAAGIRGFVEANW